MFVIWSSYNNDIDYDNDADDNDEDEDEDGDDDGDDDLDEDDDDDDDDDNNGNDGEWWMIGFQALQAHRVSHWLWLKGRFTLGKKGVSLY